MTTADPGLPEAFAAATRRGATAREVLRAGAVFILLAAMLVGFTVAQPAFIGINNLMSILQAVSVVAILGT
ncbi:MAG TPA: ABC transporter permease, partial [Rubrivivax sp.]|nr:ABC transporter permease [Rubrivivax sp.]